jgi:predicted RecB family nuclease
LQKRHSNKKEMTTPKKNLRTCSKGHKFYKPSDCPTCPICENERKPGTGFLSLIAAPARRALEAKGIKTLEQLSRFSKAEILKLHGMGAGSLPKLRSALKTIGLSFKK